MEYNFQFKKMYGQNFIREANIVEKICHVAEIKENSLVIEIGAGSGMLTRELAKVSGHVLTYEIDEALEDILAVELKEYSNIDIIFDDFLHRDLIADLKNYTYEHLYVVANLPYYITTPIITRIIDSNLPVEKIVVMVQKEVGDRFSAKVGTKDYNSLTVFLNYYFSIKKEFLVSRNCFVPKPNVDSVVVSFTKKENRLEVFNLELFFSLVRDSFKFKRKTLRNNLKNYQFSMIEEGLKQLGYQGTVRAEQLSLEDFVFLSNYYDSHLNHDS